MSHPDHITPEHDGLAGRVLDRIQDEKVTPRPRWQFEASNRLLWALWALTILVGAAAAAAMLFALSNAGWEYRQVTHDSILTYILEAIPFIWVFALVGAVLLAYENLRHTKAGYRYPLYLVIGVSFLVSTLGGLILYQIGFGNAVEEEFGGHIPMYRSALMHQQMIWEHPERGLIAGEVATINLGGGNFVLRAFDGTEWAVDGEDLDPRSLDALNRFHLVRVVGVPLMEPPTDASSSALHACFVFPWEVHGMRRALGGSMQGRAPTFDLRVATNTNEKNIVEGRSTECQGVRPYGILRALQHEDAP